MVGGDGQLLVIVYKNNNKAVLLHHFKYRNKYKIYKIHFIQDTHSTIDDGKGKFCARFEPGCNLSTFHQVKQVLPVVVSEDRQRSVCVCKH